MNLYVYALGVSSFLNALFNLQVLYLELCHLADVHSANADSTHLSIKPFQSKIRVQMKLDLFTKT